MELPLVYQLLRKGAFDGVNHKIADGWQKLPGMGRAAGSKVNATDRWMRCNQKIGRRCCADPTERMLVEQWILWYLGEQHTNRSLSYQKADLPDWA